MGGKGQRRREKNYRAAHGGSTRLPPPPDPSSLDPLPSKLRKIMSFSVSGAGKKPSNAMKINGGRGVEKRILSGEECDSTTRGMKRVGNDPNTVAQHMKHSDQVLQHSSREKKRKRKRREVKDLRFEGSEGLSLAVSKRKERKKQRLEARKKKHKKARTEEEAVDFQGHEEIKFGEVVEAPPKLIAVPKVSKTTQDASQERLRLQAVDAYRKRKGWTSRLGIQLPSLVPT